MDIHYLSSSTLISDSANSVHVMKMSDALSSLGNQITLHAYNGDGDKQAVRQYYGTRHEFEIKRHDEHKHGYSSLLWALRAKLPFFKVSGLPSTLFARQYLRKEIKNADLLYARNLYWLFGLSKTKPFIIEIHHPPRNWLDQWIENKLYASPNCKGIVLISEKMLEIYKEKHPRHAGKFIVAHDGADDPGKTDIRSQCERPLKDIGYVGQLYKGRGIEIIIKAAEALPDMRFHIVGGRPEVIEEYTSLGTPNNVIFHGHQPHTKLPEFYKTFDAVLSPYQKKVAVHGDTGNTAAFMSPLKIFEYMSWGLPILCSDMPVLREILRSEQNCLLIPPEDANSWVEGLRRLNDDPSLRLKLATQARKDFIEKHSWQARAEDILKRAQI